MVSFTLSSVESCGDDHGISSREEGLGLSLGLGPGSGPEPGPGLGPGPWPGPGLGPGPGPKLLPPLGRELWRWSWHIFYRKGGLPLQLLRRREG